MCCGWWGRAAAAAATHSDTLRCCLGAEETQSKIDVAKEVAAGIVDKLSPDDRLAVVLFSDGGAAGEAPALWLLLARCRADCSADCCLRMGAPLPAEPPAAADACVPKPLGALSCANTQELKAGLQRDVEATASTNLEAGLAAGAGRPPPPQPLVATAVAQGHCVRSSCFKRTHARTPHAAATKQLSSCEACRSGNPADTENRIVLLTGGLLRAARPR